MAKSPNNSRAQLIEAAAILLRRQGYYNTSLKQIASLASAPLGSVYFLFPKGKDELVLAALDHVGDQGTHALEALLSTRSSPEDVVRAYNDALAELLLHSGFIDGCPIATVALEAAPRNDAIADHIQQIFTRWILILRKALLRTGLARHSAEIVAATTLAATEGGLIVARAARDDAEMKPVRAGLVALVRALHSTSG